MGETVRFLMQARMLPRARAGEHRLTVRLQAALQSVGWTLELDRLGQPAGGYHLTWMEAPAGPLGLCIRQAYVAPFFRIDRTNERWNFRIARQPFRPEDIDPKPAARFAAYWRERLYGDMPATSGGGVYVPLQGLLTERRSFQAASPVEMLRKVLDRFPDRPVTATLHPAETYSDSERAALSALAARHPRLILSTGGMPERLRTCDFVVTQNSSAAFHALFFGKPAALFARIDFHHVMLNVPRIGADAALSAVPTHRPEAERYLWWFLKGTAINASAPEAEAQVLAALRENGWPL